MVIKRSYHGWMPEATDLQRPHRPAHYVPEGARRVDYVHGFALIARCGAECLPLYPGADNRRIVQHPKCPECESPGTHAATYPRPAMFTRIGE
ncbi:MAG: hypothetical protein ACRDQ7_19275 [Haloechinothrix sp.]